MSKDPTRNIDRYKIRGGQMNTFEFHKNQGVVSEQQQEHGNWAGAPEEMSDLPPDKAKAERIRQLLAKHGESVPQADGASTEEHPIEKRNREQAGRDSEIEDEEEANKPENAEEDFAPTHGRSPKVIKEMIQSRRATDQVPDPEDVTAGRSQQSEEKKEHGETGRRTATRRINKQTERSSQTTRSQYQKATKGKEAALDQSKSSAAKSTTSKKAGKPAATPKSVKQSATATSRQQSSKKAAPARRTKSAKKAAATSSGKQTAARKNKAGTSARSNATTKTASARAETKSKAKTGSAKARRTATPKRAKARTAKSR